MFGQSLLLGFGRNRGVNFLVRKGVTVVIVDELKKYLELSKKDESARIVTDLVYHSTIGPRAAELLLEAIDVIKDVSNCQRAGCIECAKRQDKFLKKVEGE